MEVTIARFRRLLFFSGAFNICLALPLAIPWLLGPYLTWLGSLNSALGFAGQPLSGPSVGGHALLANTAGIDLVLIGVLVLYAGFDPAQRRFIPLANAVGRLLFALVVGYYVFVFDVARLVLIIGGIDVVISIGFLFLLAQLAAGERAAVELTRPAARR